MIKAVEAAKDNVVSKIIIVRKFEDVARSDWLMKPIAVLVRLRWQKYIF